MMFTRIRVRPSLLRTRTFAANLGHYDNRKSVILGIESSCDDTGSAIVDSNGRILGDTLHSQRQIHLRYGGIIGPVAQNFHRQNIERNVSATLAQAKLKMEDVDAIAVTNRPGLSLSLTVGVRYARHLARRHSKPIIPVHHMQAHALTARIEHPIAYPFLCLLVSGGHCILTFVRDVEEFAILGETINNAPGQCFDKVARELQLQHLAEFADCSGGVAIERAAGRSANPDRFTFSLPLERERSCRFSFGSIKSTAYRFITLAREQENLSGAQVMRHYDDLCAGYLRAITKHIVRRTQRAMEYCDEAEWWNDVIGRRFVVSGGVACNDFIYTALQQLCAQFKCEIYRPSKKLCTDNGIMIAWNGVERWLADQDRYLNSNIDDIEILTKQPIGIDWTNQLETANIKCQWAKLTLLQSS